MKGAFSLNHLVYPPSYFFSSKDLEIWGGLTDNSLDFVFCKEDVALGAPDREIQRRVTVQVFPNYVTLWIAGHLYTWLFFLNRLRRI